MIFHTREGAGESFYEGSGFDCARLYRIAKVPFTVESDPLGCSA